MTLYEINAEIREKCDAITAVGVESAEAEQLFAELESLYTTREAKHEGYVHVIRNAEARAEALRGEAQAFLGRAHAARKLAERLKQQLLVAMQQQGEDVLDAGLFRVRRQVSTPAVDIHVEPEALPMEFQKVNVSVDKVALRKALQSGRPAAGAELVRGEHVRIRFK